MDNELAVVPSDEFRFRMSNFLDEVRWNSKRFEITRRGTPYAVVISGPDYEYLVKAAAELAELKGEQSS